MIRCSAILGSGALPHVGESWKGEICAVYEHSVHLKAEGRYLTLGAPGLAPHPYSILWKIFPEEPRLGMGCTVTRYGVTFENGESLNFRCMELFTPATSCRETASQDRILAAVNAALDAALSHTDKNELLVLATRQQHLFPHDASSVTTAMRLREESLLLALAEALISGDQALFVAASEEMAGFGQGLTPSGDDFLAGVYSALRFRHQSCLPTVFTPGAIAKAASAASRKTSGFSGFLLESAASGQIAEPLSDWLDAVHRGDAEGAVALVGSIAALGHSSGLDCFAGMVLALQLAMGGSAWTR